MYIVEEWYVEVGECQRGPCQGSGWKNERELDMQTPGERGLGEEAARLRPEVDWECSRLGVWEVWAGGPDAGE